MAFAFSPDYFEISKNLDIFNAVYRELNVSYVDGTKPGQLMKTGIDAMLGSLDPYTVYYTENDIEEYRYMTTGEYGGIGATVNDIDGKIVVAEPYEGFPAFKAGIRAGDEIVGVNNVSVVGKKTDDISNLLKGQAGTPIKLRVVKAGAKTPEDVTLNREEIKTKAVPYSGMLAGTSIGYIKLVTFTERCSNEVNNALAELRKQNCSGLVLDLRGNLGGLLNEAVNIVNFFTDKGQEVVSTKGKVQEWDKSYLSVNNPVDTQLPLVVLVDENSASASEIVCGALQDLDRAVIVGRRTYGKGLVQQTKDLVYQAKIKVTVAKYYIPSGRCVQALDYTHRDEEGRVDKVPDSLITAFKTKGGRIVYDGAGVMPDVKTQEEKFSNILIALVSRYHIFNYATLYANAHPQIASVRDFHLTDAEYADFVSYLSDKNCDYTSHQQADLEDIRKEMADEPGFDGYRAEFDELLKKMKVNKSLDLAKYKDQVRQQLEEEIVSRYYFQKGRLEFSLRDDRDLAAGIDVLRDQQRLHAILSKVEKADRPFNPGKKF